MKKKYIVAVILAAGKGSRMGIPYSKQLVKLNEVPILVRSVKVFETLDIISDILVVCRESDKISIEKLIKEYKLQKVSTLLKGEQTRQGSAFKAAEFLLDKNVDYIAVHDGARALVSKKVITDTIQEAIKYGAAISAVPMKDTVKELDNNMFCKKTLDRSKLWLAQTPQAFKFDLYLNAMYKAKGENKTYTDDCGLLEAIGVKVKIVSGSYDNIKITTPDDISIALRILEKRGKKF